MCDQILFADLCLLCHWTREQFASPAHWPEPKAHPTSRKELEPAGTVRSIEPRLGERELDVVVQLRAEDPLET